MAWVRAGRSPQLALPDLPSLGTSNGSVSQLRALSQRDPQPGQLLYRGKLRREKHMGMKEWDSRREMTVYGHRVQLEVFRTGFQAVR